MNDVVTVALTCSLLVLLALVPSFSQEKAKPNTRTLGYTIDLDTSGGFSGRGRGGITIDSDGRREPRGGAAAGTAHARRHCRSTR